MNKLLIAVLIIIVISYGAWYLNKSNHLDINYRFILKNFNNWEEIPRNLGAYKSFATHKDDNMISYADIRFIKKEKSLGNKTMIDMTKMECQNLAKEPSITSYTIEVSEFKKDESTVVVCTGDGISGVNKLPTTITIYYFFGLEDDILMLTTYYPSGNNTEKMNVKNLIDGIIFF
ncbi:MAG: hypothetical protein ACD_24C00375G0002 [uncultured bacterium]|uniref:PsbP C-terminal domain-containing protein n=1 Tax=candidate division WWE3 bacterium RBG_16_37_10 TaxID=1802610 RepID=A0A1F4UXH9_UNCKA|nr:MAG: hypothetical protein ACD_24C00375G0002 [uncultured bacterium]OGC49649.1 MAG: hypothetical protein A2W32_04910 [candidate division WWE3 bacterium RBG_16_37_10]